MLKNKNPEVFNCISNKQLFTKLTPAEASTISAGSSCQEAEGNWDMTTVWPDGKGRYEHQLNIGVRDNCSIVGQWIDKTSGNSVSAINGQINGNDIQFVRSGGGLDRSQSYTGHWTPTFAGGKFETLGLFYMTKT